MLNTIQCERVGQHVAALFLAKRHIIQLVEICRSYFRFCIKIIKEKYENLDAVICFTQVTGFKERLRTSKQHRVLFQTLRGQLTTHHPNSGKGPHCYTTRWEIMLTSRRVSILLYGDRLVASTVRGCPHCGVISPLLWTLAVDQLLYKLAELNVDAQSYADDLVITDQAHSQSTILSLLQGTPYIVSAWCHENDLSINVEKTTIVPFTKKL